ncbi:hypothetical protein [Pseudalkalibacillus berkeleyi]|uniref:Uncharacterized protein n=1 Tax=Pseudalkalibacillus berkeleyi TaxID=1069813 RepID=A0ABS9H756_9BACL|nr:hypothetical protein [Pseudalkalibacillus berkeleyi]MCF6139625.1 hypothetical protein [Pseudalkalibacillus berkeleyi]
MDDKLKQLDQIMDKAVYQKKRFTDARKQAVMKQIREQPNPPMFLEKYMGRIKPLLSLAVCLCFLLFSVTYILEPPQKGEKFIDGALLTSDQVVTSLPLINRVAHIAIQENGFIEYVNVTKREKFVSLNIEIASHASKAEVRSSVEEMFHKGTELYTGIEAVEEIGQPWIGYTVEINVRKQHDKKGVWKEQNDSAFVRGLKQNDQNKITWLDKEKGLH